MSEPSAFKMALAGGADTVPAVDRNSGVWVWAAQKLQSPRKAAKSKESILRDMLLFSEAVATFLDGLLACRSLERLASHL